MAGALLKKAITPGYLLPLLLFFFSCGKTITRPEPEINVAATNTNAIEFHVSQSQVTLLQNNAITASYSSAGSLLVWPPPLEPCILLNTHWWNSILWLLPLLILPGKRA